VPVTFGRVLVSDESPHEAMNATIINRKTEAFLISGYYEIKSLHFHAGLNISFYYPSFPLQHPYQHHHRFPWPF